MDSSTNEKKFVQWPHTGGYKAEPIRCKPSRNHPKRVWYSYNDGSTTRERTQETGGRGLMLVPLEKSPNNKELTTSEQIDIIKYALNVVEEVVKRKDKGDKSCIEILNKLEFPYNVLSERYGTCAQCGGSFPSTALKQSNQYSDYEYCPRCINYV